MILEVNTSPRDDGKQQNIVIKKNHTADYIWSFIDKICWNPASSLWNSDKLVSVGFKNTLPYKKCFIGRSGSPQSQLNHVKLLLSITGKSFASVWMLFFWWLLLQLYIFSGENICIYILNIILSNIRWKQHFLTEESRNVWICLSYLYTVSSFHTIHVLHNRNSIYSPKTPVGQGHADSHLRCINSELKQVNKHWNKEKSQMPNDVILLHLNCGSLDPWTTQVLVNHLSSLPGPRNTQESFIRQI